MVASNEITREDLEREVEKLRKQLDRKPHCRCGVLATKLCDRELARSFSFGDMRVLVCSRPICDKCAITEPGLIFWCGSKGCDVETVDYCPSHPTDSHEISVMSPFELERLQQKFGGEIQIVPYGVRP